MASCSAGSQPAGLISEPFGLPSTYHFNSMINRINNAICLLVVAAVFAMIGIEAGSQSSATHSGNQAYVEVRK